MGTPGGHKPKFWPKISPNIDIMQALYCYFILLYITLFYFIFTWVKNLLYNHSFYFILLYFTLFQLQSTENRLFYY